MGSRKEKTWIMRINSVVQPSIMIFLHVCMFLYCSELPQKSQVGLKLCNLNTITSLTKDL